MKYNVWIVFHWQFDAINNKCMMPCVVGVFDDRSLAVASCVDSKHYIVPMEMNKKAPQDPVAHPGIFYPKKDRD